MVTLERRILFIPGFGRSRLSQSKQTSSSLIKWSRSQTRNSTVDASFENQTAQYKETRHPVSRSFHFQNPGSSKILSLRFGLSSPVFSEIQLGARLHACMGRCFGKLMPLRIETVEVLAAVGPHPAPVLQNIGLAG